MEGKRTGKRSQRIPRTTAMDPIRPVKSHVQDTADNADEEELRDSLLFVDPFTQELELHLREAAIEFQLDWEKIKNSEKYANIFEKMTPEMLKAKYIEMAERDNEDKKQSNPGITRKEDAPEISDGGSSRKTDSDSSSKTRTDDGSVKLRRSARLVSSKKGSGVVTQPRRSARLVSSKKGSGIVIPKGAKGTGDNKGKNPKNAKMVKVSEKNKPDFFVGDSSTRNNSNKNPKNAKMVKVSEKNKPDFFVGDSSTRNNSNNSVDDPVLKALLDGNKLMGEILTKVTIAVEILQEEKEKEKEK